MISDVRSVRVGHLETLSHCAPNLSQGAPSLSQGAHMLYSNLDFSQIHVVFRYLIRCLKVPQVVSQGARVRGTLRHFFENVLLKMKGYTFLKIYNSCLKIPHWMLYSYVSSKCFISKIKYMF